jgi:hypothetical protein
VNADSVALLWTHDPQVPRPTAAKACRDVVNRGVALYKGKIFVGTLDGRLQALDAATGQLLWDVMTVDPSRPYTITGAPRVAKGLVLIGNGGAELGVRGYVSAYDAETGALRWRTYTVPGDPSHPFESKALEAAARTWKGGEWWKIGGGGTVWDYTATQQITLADLTIDGKPRKVILHAPKNGFFYVIHRVSGKLISAEKYAAVTWAKRVDPKTGLVYIPAQEIPALHALGGTAKLLASATAQTASAAPKVSPKDGALVKSGEALFAANCALCHGMGVVGGGHVARVVSGASPDREGDGRAADEDADEAGGADEAEPENPEPVARRDLAVEGRRVPVPTRWESIHAHEALAQQRMVDGAGRESDREADAHEPEPSREQHLGGDDVGAEREAGQRREQSEGEEELVHVASPTRDREGLAPLPLRLHPVRAGGGRWFAYWPWWAWCSPRRSGRKLRGPTKRPSAIMRRARPSCWCSAGLPQRCLPVCPRRPSTGCGARAAPRTACCPRSPRARS